MKKFLQILLPVVAVAIGVLVAWLLVKFGKKAEPVPTEVKPPLVEVVSVSATNHQFVVHSQGNVVAPREIQLTAEVAGKITQVAAAFTMGGFFQEGELLLTIDPRDYELAVQQAEAKLAQAQVVVTREESEAEVARREWERHGQGAPSPLLLREPQLAEARALVKSAEASLEQARRNLERCQIKAPFAGRVESKSVDIGQFVATGTPLAKVYATDYAEIMLPIPEDELEFVDLPLAFQTSEANPGPRVRLIADFAGATHTWEGSIVRTAGRIDTRTRMVTAVARVDHPYEMAQNSSRPPLAVGMYVQAEILGHPLEDVILIPREAVREGHLAWRYEEDSLHEVEVKVVRLTRTSGIISSGLNDGDRICVSRINTFVSGMKVRTEEAR